MPYPLPDDPESVTNLTWKVIAIPDDPAYSRAALDRYSGISDVWNWGLEGVEAGSHVARQSWLTAVLATLELWDVNPLETIIGLIDLVETLLEQIRDGQCCDGVVGDPIADLRTDDWSTGDAVPANVVSAGFASSSTDQDGYDDYKCVIANVAVQDLIEKVSRAATYIDAGGKLVGGIAAIAALLAFVFAGPALTTLTALSLGIVGATGAAAVLFGFFSDAGKVNIEAMAEDLTDAYADLVCAIYTADGNEDAKDALAAELSATVGATAAAAIRIISDMVIDALYAGRYDATNTAQALADAGFDGTEFTCSSCVAPDELEGWVIDNWIADSSEGAVTVTQLEARKYRFELTGGAANSKTLFVGPHLISALCPGSTANMPDGTITLYVDVQGTLNTSVDAVSEFISWTWGNNCEDEPSTNPNTNTGASFTPNLAIDRQFQITWDYPTNVNTAIVRGGLASVHATTFDLTIEITRIVVTYT